MQIKTNTLTDQALDWAVASAEGAVWAVWRFKERHTDGEMNYSTSWAHGGPIIEREGIALLPREEGDWSATCEDGAWHGPTPLTAAMRCFVASRLGDEVDIPEELK